MVRNLLFLLKYHLLNELHQYHLTCIGLYEMPVSDWFCDEYCAHDARDTSSKKCSRK